MAMDELQLVFDAPMQLGESPLWHPLEQALYWIDIAGQAVHRHVPAGGEHKSWRLPSEPGCIAWCRDGGILVAMRSGLAILDTADSASDGHLTPLADAPYDSTKIRFNDGRCDASGRFWAGTLYEPRDRPLGSVFCLERGVVRDARLPVTVSNGLAFSRDNRVLYHADTSAHRITAYNFDVVHGEVGDGRLFMQFSSDRAHGYSGRPDGAAVDSEGAYWCAMYEGGRILRVSPAGEILREIVLPVRCPTMIAFGNADLRTLYITSARHNRTAEELTQYPLSGCVLSLRVDVAGQAEPAYIP